MSREPINRFFIYYVDAVEIKCSKSLLADNDSYDSGDGEVTYTNDWVDTYSSKIRETLELEGYDSSNYIDVDVEDESIVFYYLNDETGLLVSIDNEDIYFPSMREGEFIKIDSMFIEQITGVKRVKNIVSDGEEVEILKKVYNLCDNSVDYYIKRFDEKERHTITLGEDVDVDNKLDLVEDELSGSDAFVVK